MSNRSEAKVEPPNSNTIQGLRLPRRRRRYIVGVALLAGLAAITAAVLLQRGSPHISGVLIWMRELWRLAPKLAAIAIFAVTYFAMAVGRLPGFKSDRASAAFIGATLMVACGVLPLSDAYRAIDFNTITLLLGVMIVVADLRLSGFLRFASRAIVKRARHPLALLAAVVMLTGILSAFFVNDAICLAMTPLVLDLVTEAARDPIPYLLAIAMASNIGSTATITGNPQNMIVGSVSHIPYGTFAAALSPVAVIGLLLTVAVISLVYRSEFYTRERLSDDLPPIDTSKSRMTKPVLVSLAMVAAFFARISPARAAISAGGILLLTRRIDFQRIFREINWTLLLMFIGLFIVVAGLEKSVLTPQVVGAIAGLHLESVVVLSSVTAILSNLVSNVPAVLILRPFVAPLRDQEKVWLTVAMASTLAGNFTLVGSVANLIVAQSAEARGVRIGFWDYFKVGAPLTLITIALGVLWL